MTCEEIIHQLDSIAENSATMTDEPGDIWDNDVCCIGAVVRLIKLLQANKDTEVKGEYYLNILEGVTNAYYSEQKSSV